VVLTLGAGDITRTGPELPDWVSVEVRRYLEHTVAQVSIRELARKARSRSTQLNITIKPAPGTPTEYVVAVMELAMRYDINGILATGEGR